VNGRGRQTTGPEQAHSRSVEDAKGGTGIQASSALDAQLQYVSVESNREREETLRRTDMLDQVLRRFVCDTFIATCDVQWDSAWQSSAFFCDLSGLC
jgi:hypothetical protein